MFGGSTAFRTAGIGQARIPGCEQPHNDHRFAERQLPLRSGSPICAPIPHRVFARFRGRTPKDKVDIQLVEVLYIRKPSIVQRIVEKTLLSSRSSCEASQELDERHYSQRSCTHRLRNGVRRSQKEEQIMQGTDAISD
jgi:hypothetical protein